MSSSILSAACAVLLVAGCASSRPPQPASATAGHSPDWAAGAANSDEFQFTPQPEAAAKPTAAPVAMKVDSVSSNDVKHTHLNAATR
jgi:hypothetical protein